MPELFNAAAYLTERRVAAGDGDRVALRHPRGAHTYAELLDEVRRVAGGLAALGVRPEERVVLCMTDDIELATGILATMYLGAIAVPTSTMLTGGNQGRRAEWAASRRQPAPRRTPWATRRAGLRKNCGRNNTIPAANGTANAHGRITQASTTADAAISSRPAPNTLIWVAPLRIASLKPANSVGSDTSVPRAFRAYVSAP